MSVKNSNSQTITLSWFFKNVFLFFSLNYRDKKIAEGNARALSDTYSKAEAFVTSGLFKHKSKTKIYLRKQQTNKQKVRKDLG